MPKIPTKVEKKTEPPKELPKEEKKEEKIEIIETQASGIMGPNINNLSCYYKYYWKKVGDKIMPCPKFMDKTCLFAKKTYWCNSLSDFEFDCYIYKILEENSKLKKEVEALKVIKYE